MIIVRGTGAVIMGQEMNLPGPLVTSEGKLWPHPDPECLSWALTGTQAGRLLREGLKSGTTMSWKSPLKCSFIEMRKKKSWCGGTTLVMTQMLLAFIFGFQGDTFSFARSLERESVKSAAVFWELKPWKSIWLFFKQLRPLLIKAGTAYPY